jgi:hypothetical protein
MQPVVLYRPNRQYNDGLLPDEFRYLLPSVMLIIVFDPSRHRELSW